MTPEEIAEKEKADTAAAKAKAEADAEDLLQKTKRSEKDKAERSLHFNAERLRELGGDPAKVLELSTEVDETPDWYRKEEAKKVQQTALQLAESIEDETERAAVKDMLSTRIVPSGNPEADFRLAFGSIRGQKNKEIIEEMGRRIPTRVIAAGGSKPLIIEDEFVPTPEEQVMMRKPYNLSKEKILLARKKTAEKQ